MTNPFDDPDGVFHVLVNAQGQHSLWPSFVAVPAGWTVVLEAVDREVAGSYVEANWPDLRPNGLVAGAEKG